MKSKLNNNPDITIDDKNPANVQYASRFVEFLSVFKDTNLHIWQAYKISFSITFSHERQHIQEFLPLFRWL